MDLKEIPFTTKEAEDKFYLTHAKMSQKYAAKLISNESKPVKSA